MPSPYGITDVDIPGALGVYLAARQGRMQNLLLERRVAAEDRATAAEKTKAEAWSKFLKPGGGDPASTGGAPSSPPATGGPPAAPSARPYDPFMDPSRRQELMSSLPPEEAFALRQEFSKMDAQQLEHVQESYKLIGNVAFQLSQLPADQRAAALQQIAPTLIQMGIPQETIAKADLSDRGLQMLSNLPRDVEKLITESKPDWAEVDGAMINRKMLPQDQLEAYTSPFPKIVSGPNGELIPLYRPGAQPSGPAGGSLAPPTVGEVRKGYRFKGGNPADRNAWEPAGGAGSQGPQTFP